MPHGTKRVIDLDMFRFTSVTEEPLPTTRIVERNNTNENVADQLDIYFLSSHQPQLAHAPWREERFSILCTLRFTGVTEEPLLTAHDVERYCFVHV